ncbi:hypothetical protein CMO88_02500 [Candidatus Woesearchaeota archaeon]|nr:hypothetical protein [Candidatus Woesearchaeota archaeon]
MMKRFKFATVFLLMLVGLAVAAFAQPTLPDIGVQSVNEGDLLKFNFILTAGSDSPAADPLTIFTICSTTSGGTCTGTANADGESIISSLGGTQANLTNISNTEAQFNWTPSFTAAGTYYVQFEAKDLGVDASSDTELVTLTVVDVAPTLEVGDLSIGSKSQRRSNPRDDDENDRERNETGTITVTNTGNEQLTDLTATVTLGSEAGKAGSLSLADLAYKDITIPAEGLILDAGESTTVSVEELRIPENLNAVDEKGVAKSFHVLDISFAATRGANQPSTTVTGTSKVTMQAENNLEIEDLVIKFNGDEENVDDGDDVEDVRPGVDVLMDFTLENLFKDDEDVQIERITVEVENNGDLEVRKEVDGNNLATEETDVVDVEFDIDEKTNRGSEDLKIIVLGEDENGARHGENWVVTLKIEREAHEIDIKSLSLQPQTISCESDAQLAVEIRNTGTRKEKDTYVRIESLELQHSEVSDQIEIKENKEKTVNFIVPIPENLEPKNYRITVETYYDTSDKSVVDGILLKKVACGDEEVVEPEQPEDVKKDDIVVVTPPTVTPPAEVTTGDVVAPLPTVDEEKTSFLEGNSFMIMLVLAYIVVLGGGALVAIKLLRK